VTLVVKRPARLRRLRNAQRPSCYLFCNSPGSFRDIGRNPASSRISPRPLIEHPCSLSERQPDARAMLDCHTVVTEALVEGSERIDGIVAYTKEGPLSVRARVTIDASGDADIVAMAGLPTFVGQGGCGPRLFLCLSRDSRLGQRIDHSLPVEVAYSGMDRVSHSPCL
jgi:hypothetical protein